MTKANEKHSSILVIFDEAEHLGPDLIARLKMALDRFAVIGIFLSTCGPLNALPPASSGSFRGSGKRPLPLLCCLHTTDIFRGCNKLTMGRPLWYHYLQTNCTAADRYDELVKYALRRLSGMEVGHTTKKSSTRACSCVVLGGFTQPTVPFRRTL
jgi:hypothetical protein